jgi:hypothetical protein
MPNPAGHFTPRVGPRNQDGRLGAPLGTRARTLRRSILALYSRSTSPSTCSGSSGRHGLNRCRGARRPAALAGRAALPGARARCASPPAGWGVQARTRWCSKTVVNPPRLVRGLDCILQSVWQVLGMPGLCELIERTYAFHDGSDRGSRRSIRFEVGPGVPRPSRHAMLVEVAQHRLHLTLSAAAAAEAGAAWLAARACVPGACAVLCAARRVQPPARPPDYTSACYGPRKGGQRGAHPRGVCAGRATRHRLPGRARGQWRGHRAGPAPGAQAVRRSGGRAGAGGRSAVAGQARPAARRPGGGLHLRPPGAACQRTEVKRAASVHWRRWDSPGP